MKINEGRKSGAGCQREKFNRFAIQEVQRLVQISRCVN